MARDSLVGRSLRLGLGDYVWFGIDEVGVSTPKKESKPTIRSHGPQAEHMTCDHVCAIALNIARATLRNARHRALATPLPPDVVALATKSGFRPQRRTSLRRMRVC